MHFIATFRGVANCNNTLNATDSSAPFGVSFLVSLHSYLMQKPDNLNHFGV